MDNPMTSLLELSDELRLNIFKHLFKDVVVRVGRGTRTRTSVAMFPQFLSIFLVCKQLHQDSALFEAFHRGIIIKIGGMSRARTEGELVRFQQIIGSHQLTLSRCDISDALSTLPVRVMVPFMSLLQNVRELHVHHWMICNCWQNVRISQLRSATLTPGHGCDSKCRKPSTIVIDKFFNVLRGRLKPLLSNVLETKRMVLFMEAKILLKGGGANSHLPAVTGAAWFYQGPRWYDAVFSTEDWILRIEDCNTYPDRDTDGLRIEPDGTFLDLPQIKLWEDGTS